MGMRDNYHGEQCVIGIYHGNQEKTRDQYCIVHVENELPGWEKVQNKMYSGWKMKRQPINWFLEAHQEVIAVVTAKVVA